MNLESVLAPRKSNKTRGWGGYVNKVALQAYTTGVISILEHITAIYDVAQYVFYDI